MNDIQEQKNDEQNNPIDFFVEQLESTDKLRDETNKDYVSIRSENIKQRRDFFQHLTILSGAVIGFSSIFGYERILNLLYFRVGFCLNLAFIVAITLYFREILDEEADELLGQQDKYNVIIEDRKKIMESYLLKPVLTKEDIKEYLQKVDSTESSKALNAEVEKMNKETRKRISGEKEMDYSGEFFVFLFVFASFFIFISFFFEEMNLYLLLLIIVLMVGLIFTNSAVYFIKKLSKLINFIKK